MNLLITGAHGMLGQELHADAERRGHTVIATDRDTLDIADLTAVREALRAQRPDAVLHCAAYTNVDAAEAHVDAAYAVNALGSWHLAAACAETDTWLACVSTDFVFDGAKGAPYDEFDPVRPISVYGASKEVGERLVRQTLPARHLICRTAYLYGPYGKNLVESILRFARSQPQLTFVEDQIVSPTHTADLSRVLLDLVENPLPGTYHVASAGECSLYEFAQAAVHLAGLTTPVAPTTFAEYVARFQPVARRPLISPLERRSLKMRGMDTLPHWRDALAAYLARPKE
jgi:dTDP-4-dehydrorhamnose reductase